MDDCVFCHHLTDEQTLLATQHFIVVFDIDPIQPAHILIIAKNHYMALQELPMEVLIEWATLQKQLCQIIENEYQLSGVSVVTNNHGVMDEGVHFHTHIIPRMADDKFWDGLNPRPLDLDVNRLKNTLKKLR